MKNKILKHYQAVPFKQDVVQNNAFKSSLTYHAIEKYDFKRKQICDIGCSTAFIGSFLRLNYPEYKYLGVDFNLRAIKIAHSGRINVMVGDNMSIPLLDECSDFTISEGVIHHTRDPYRCFKELIRITKRGGYISLLVYNKNSYYYYIFKSCGLLRYMYQTRMKLSRCTFLKKAFYIYYFTFTVLITKLLGIKKNVPLKEVLSNFHDQILNPLVYFFRKREIMAFAESNGLILCKFKTKLMEKSLTFIFKKCQ